jgi:hypothetical protein
VAQVAVAVAETQVAQTLRPEHRLTTRQDTYVAYIEQALIRCGNAARGKNGKPTQSSSQSKRTQTNNCIRGVGVRVHALSPHGATVAMVAMYGIDATVAMLAIVNDGPKIASGERCNGKQTRAAT